MRKAAWRLVTLFTVDYETWVLACGSRLKTGLRHIVAEPQVCFRDGSDGVRRASGLLDSAE